VTIIDRLARNAQKQREYRHIVRGRGPGVSEKTAKRIADMYFLRKYAQMGFGQLGRLFKVSRERARQIAGKDNKRNRRMEFTICHPKKSCM
jgi:DNA-directed RNA polymerase sigma subunit (sigma70/sigma32)